MAMLDIQSNSPQEVFMSMTTNQSADQGRPTEQRMLPNDMLAEQCTLGGMLLSQEAIAEVFDAVRGPDFYAPKHEIIYNAILELYSKGEPTDVITVTDQLTKNGDLVKAGGADYLHTLTSIVPTAANAAFYADIVREKATLRRLVEVGTKIAQMGYKAEGDIIDLVNQAESDLYGVSNQGSGEDYVPLIDSIEDAVKQMEIAQKRGVFGL
jgi:replicative DNA helicase